MTTLYNNKDSIEVGGTQLQRLASCLEVLDKIFASPVPIVSTMVVAEKREQTHERSNPLQAVLKLLNIRDVNSFSHEINLAELGADSLLVIEIRQMFEREFELFLTADEIRQLTFTTLGDLDKSVKS